MSARVLPVRFAPLPDELLSSWFVRLAHANGEKSHSLGFRIFGTKFNFIQGGDQRLDRGHDEHALASLARVTKISVSKVNAATLEAYSGYLWNETAAHGVRRWVMPVLDRAGGRTAHGLQACADCLRDDAVPYFRRSWRLALHVLCPFHDRLLLDHCPACNSPLVIHRGDVGFFSPFSESSVRWCSYCRADFAEGPTLPRGSGAEVLEFQELLLNTLRRGWINVAGRVIHSTLFFEGLRMVWAFLDAPRWSAAVRRALERRSLPLADVPGKRYGGFDVQRTEARYQLLAASAWLLNDWPNRFLSLASEANVSSNRLLHFSLRRPVSTPFWLWEPVHFSLDRTMYIPTEAEIKNAYLHLVRNGMSLRLRDVCSLLNMRTNNSRRVAAVVLSL